MKILIPKVLKISEFTFISSKKEAPKPQLHSPNASGSQNDVSTNRICRDTRSVCVLTAARTLWDDEGMMMTEFSFCISEEKGMDLLLSQCTLKAQELRKSLEKQGLKERK